MKKFLTIIGLSASLFLFSGCGPSRLVVSERPNPPVIVRPAQPYPNYVWIEGEWRISGGRYQWRNGYWTRPRANHTWVGGHWEHTNKGYYWNRGHWN